MAAPYPAAPSRRCTVRPLNRAPALAPNGAPRDRWGAPGLARATAWQVEVEHRWISDAELAALRAWAAAVRRGEIDVAAGDGATYRCRLLDADYRERARRGPFATVSIRLVGRAL